MILGARESSALVAIDQPRRAYRVGEKVEILCRAMSKDIRVSWERYGTNQYVAYRVSTEKCFYLNLLIKTYKSLI